MSALLAQRPVEIPAAAESWLAGRTVVHKIVIGLSDPSACLTAVAEEFQHGLGRIEGLALSALSGGAYEAVLRAADLSVDEAEHLVSRLCVRQGVRSVQIEHMLIR
jgi:hypothetical protein